MYIEKESAGYDNNATKYVIVSIIMVSSDFKIAWIMRRPSQAASPLENMLVNIPHNEGSHMVLSAK